MRQITEETIHMKAIVVTDQAAGTAGMKLVERPEPQAAINESENWSIKSALSGPKIMRLDAMGARLASSNSSPWSLCGVGGSRRIALRAGRLWLPKAGAG